MTRLTALALFLATTSAQAQPETVIVERSRGLEGLWKLSVPAGFSVSFGGPAKFGPMRDIYCRITRDNAIRCLNEGYAESGAVEIEGNAVHIAWGSMMVRMAIDAVYKDGSLNGTFAFKLGGIRHDAPERSIGERVVPRAGRDEESKYLAGILAQLSAGKAPSSLDSKSIKAHRGAIPADIGKLGNIEAVTFLGQTPVWIESPAGILYDVSIVDFMNGERLCGVHRNSDGVLDAFHCV